MSLPVEKALLKAQSHIKAGELDEAEELYKLVLSKFPQEKKAIQGYQKLKESHPPQAAVDQIVGLYNQDKLEQTVSLAESLASQYPNALILYDILGASNAALQRYDAAIDSYKQVIKTKPDYADAYNNMGVALYDQGRFDEAVENYQKAVKLEPDFADAHYNLANTLQQTGDLKQAIESYKASLAINPNDAEVLLGYGNALKSYGNFEQAIEIYAQALKFDPNSAAAQTNMDNTVEEQTELEKNIADYARNAKLEIGCAKIVSFTGKMLKAKGYLDAAIDSYKQAIKIKSDYADAYYNMGNALKEKGELDAAIDSYKQAIKIKPDYAVAYMGVGNALHEKDELDAAVDSYKKALKINSNLPFAYKSWQIIVRQKNDLVSEIKKDIIKFLNPLLDGLPVGKALWEFSILAELCNDSNFRTAILEKAMSKDVIFEPKDPKNLMAPPIKKGWKPKVSICCLTYNQQATLGRTLSSFFEQDFEQPFEVIISEDASTDETFDVAARWQKQFPEHIKIIKFKENVFSAGRNGLEVFYHLAQGDFLAYCEGDDFWLSTKKLKWQVEALEQYPEYNSCTHSILRLSPFAEGQLPYRRQNAEIGGKLTFEDPFFLQNRNRSFLIQTLVHRNTGLSFRLPPECFLCDTQDQVLTSYLGQIGGNIHMSEFIGSARVLHPFSVWTPLSHKEKQLQQYRATYAIYQMNRRLGAERAADHNYALLPTYEVPNDQATKVAKDFKIRLPQVKKFAVQDLEFDII